MSLDSAKFPPPSKSTDKQIYQYILQLVIFDLTDAVHAFLVKKKSQIKLCSLWEYILIRGEKSSKKLN